MKKNKYSLELNAYFLDFSFPGMFTAETRVFINLPLDSNSQGYKSLDICFEMNSVYATRVQPLTLMVFLDEEKHRKSKNQKIINFTNEHDLHNSIPQQVKIFLDETYAKWPQFYEETKEKYISKHKVLQKELPPENRIELFKAEVVDRIQKILTGEEVVQPADFRTSNAADDKLTLDLVNHLKTAKIKYYHAHLSENIPEIPKENNIKRHKI